MIYGMPKKQHKYTSPRTVNKMLVELTLGQWIGKCSDMLPFITTKKLVLFTKRSSFFDKAPKNYLCDKYLNLSVLKQKNVLSV